MSWTGWYKQDGQEHMMDFSNFQANPSPGGAIGGEGEDKVGKFNFHGSFSNDGTRVRFVKEYIGQHKIFYIGHVSPNPPVIQGQWGFTQDEPQDDFKLWWE